MGGPLAWGMGCDAMRRRYKTTVVARITLRVTEDPVKSLWTKVSGIVRRLLTESSVQAVRC